jgi:hypothetical protein
MLARVENMVCCPMLIPGDVVDTGYKNEKRFLEGRVVRFHEYSSDTLNRGAAILGYVRVQVAASAIYMQLKHRNNRSEIIDQNGKIDFAGINLY